MLPLPFSVVTRPLLLVVLMLLLGLAGCGKPASESTRQDEVSHGHDEEAEGHGEAGHGKAAHDEDGHEEGTHEEGGHDDALKLSPAARAAARLVVAPAGPVTLRETVSLYGIVKPNAEAVRSVTARFPGVVRSVSARVGDSVREGVPLAIVESDESLQEYPVRSPLSGVLTERFTNPGQQAQNQPLFTVANLSTVWVELTFFSRDRSRIREGQRVRVQATDGGHASDGQIVFVSPLGTSATQSLTARVLIDNRDGRWTPGLHVRGEVASAESKVDLAVPAVALQEMEGAVSVFVEGAQGFEPRRVKTGRSDGRWVEILAGLAPGEAVVGEGSFVLKAEAGKGEAEHGH